MLRLYGGLAERFTISFLAAAAAALALACIAAWTEGRAPRWSSLAELVPTLAANFAGAWTLARWRAEGGDVAVAALGRSPRPLWIFVIGLTVPVLAWAQAPLSTQRESNVMFTPDTLSVQTPRGETRYTWRDGVVIRRDPDGATASQTTFPAPLSTSPPPARPSPWLPIVLECLVAALALSWLGARRAPPGLTAALVAGAASFIGGVGIDHLVLRWLI